MISYRPESHTQQGSVRAHSPAKAPQLSFLHTLLFPGGVMMPRKNSYAAKLIPTYGATPTAVVTRPRYSARTPPSSRMIFNVMPPIVRSALVYAGTVPLAAEAARFEATAEEVWYAEASACFVCWNGIVGETLGVGAGEVREIDAVAIDSRDRTRSKGYVEPKGHYKMVNANCENMEIAKKRSA